MPVEVQQREHHHKEYRKYLDGGLEKYDGFINPQSFWHWEHVYCLQHIQEFFQKIPKSRFLTVGDGYCGREGAFIHQFGHFVHASDWEPCLLQIGKEKGLIDEYSEQNITDLKFPDESFDFVFTKESLHHLSMPYQGLYEMFRVSKRGVILIEPNGDNETRYKFPGFESVGNFMHSFSSHELIKAGIAYGFKYFMATYSIVFYTYHNLDNINNGRIEEEKQRLIQYDKSFVDISHKPLVIVFFLRNREDWEIFQDDKKFKRVCI
jgi:ubiquinone/menaquinone biosynthesis C-methylase UbiE